MDPSSSSALSAVSLGHAFELLFDRARAVLDHRAERSATAHAVSQAGRAPVAVTGVDGAETSTESIGEMDAAAEADDAAEVAAALRVLEMYRVAELELNPADNLLVQTLQRVHSALERLGGCPIDLRSETESLIKVDQKADDVYGQ